MKRMIVGKLLQISDMGTPVYFFKVKIGKTFYRAVFSTKNNKPRLEMIDADDLNGRIPNANS